VLALAPLSADSTLALLRARFPDLAWDELAADPAFRMALGETGYIPRLAIRLIESQAQRTKPRADWKHALEQVAMLAASGTDFQKLFADRATRVDSLGGPF